MNQFNQGLRAAQARQKRLHLFLSAGMLSGLVIIFGILISAYGTPIVVAPEEAAATSKIRVVEGFGFSLQDKVYSFTRKPIVTISADGFRTTNRIILPEEEGSNISVQMEPLPGVIIAATDIGKKNTRWFADSRLVSIGETLNVEIEAGDHLLKIDHPYFMPNELDITVGRGEEFKVQVQMEPVVGALEIASQPVGAMVILDGVELGVTPLAVNKQGGAYSIELTVSGFETIKDKFEITNTKKVVRRNYKLQLKDASIFVRVSPPGGQLLLNGKRIESLKTYTVKSSAKNKLSYMKNGYFSKTEVFVLKAGQHRNISLNLDQDIGKVEVRSEPEAIVFVDGIVVGKTPLTLELPAIKHKITLSKPGYRTIEKTILPSRDRIVSVYFCKFGKVNFLSGIVA